MRTTFQEVRDRLARRADRQFASGLARLPSDQATVRAAMVDAVCQFEAIDQLRARLRWSKRTVTAALEETVAHLLAPAPGPAHSADLQG